MEAAALASAPAALSSASGRPRSSASTAFFSPSSGSGRPRRSARGAIRCEVASSSAPSAAGPLAARWAQRTVVIPPQRRGCHLITPKIVNEIRNELSEFKCGLAHLFLQHTSASLTINENYDPDVQADTETFLSRIVPEGPSAPWRHTIEGPDDMPAHIKSSMFGCALTIPITNGRLNMGTWQRLDDPGVGQVNGIQIDRDAILEVIAGEHLVEPNRDIDDRVNSSNINSTPNWPAYAA